MIGQSHWAASEWVYSNSFSVSFWERTATSGDGALMGNKDWTSGANVGWVISSLDPKNLNYNAVGGTRRDVDLNPPFSDGNWHLVTVTFDRAANRVTSYMDGLAGQHRRHQSFGRRFFQCRLQHPDRQQRQRHLFRHRRTLMTWVCGPASLTPQEVAGIYGAGLDQPALDRRGAGQFRR